MACTRSDAYEDQDGVVLEPEQELRDEFSCPITCDLIYDPVIAADGHTYDRSAIQRWFSKHKTSPKTGKVLENLNLVSNINLKRLIRDLVHEGGLGLYSKSSSNKTKENIKLNSNVHNIKKDLKVKKTRMLIREKILILTCLESTTVGCSNIVYHVGQEGAEGGRGVNQSIEGHGHQFIQLLDDPTCSRKHFEINYDIPEKVFKINDMGSTSGVLVRVPYNDGHVLNQSDIICFGKHQLSVEKVSNASGGGLTLQCIGPIGSPLENSLYHINKSHNTIGRNQNSDISFTVMSHGSTSKLVGVDGAISSEHARIKCFHDSGSLSEGSSVKFVLLDGSDHKPSSNGTWLRLSPINQVSRQYPLVENSEFIIGGSRFKVSHGSTVREVEH